MSSDNHGCHWDIGSGTGLLTEVFLNSGHRVLGVESDPEMRAAAEWLLQGYARFTSIAATAEATSSLITASIW